MPVTTRAGGATTPTTTPMAASRSGGQATPAAKRRRVSRTRLQIDGDSEDDGGDQHGRERGRPQDSGHARSSDQQHSESGPATSARQRPSIPDQRRTGQQDSEDDLATMDWWDALNPSQQRSMMRRFIVQTPAAATSVAAPVTAAPVVIQPRRDKGKRLEVEDFRGKPGESIEAWLSAVMRVVQGQTRLGGDTWTSEELFYGAIMHLKDEAGMWLTGEMQHMGPADCTFEHLTERLRKKYGRHEDEWEVQQRLVRRKQQPGESLDAYANSLTHIGFGTRLPAHTYLRAFLDGMNNPEASVNTRQQKPATMDDARAHAIEYYGEYGEGTKIITWQEAARQYRRDSPKRDNVSSTAAEPVAGVTAKAGVTGPVDWAKLGLGFSGSSEPRYDEWGKPVSRLAEMWKDREGNSLPLAISLAAGIGQMATAAQSQVAEKTTTKSKVARTLEVKTEEEKPAAIPPAVSVAPLATAPTAVLQQPYYGFMPVTAATNGFAGGMPGYSAGYSNYGAAVQGPYGGSYSDFGGGRGRGRGAWPDSNHYGPGRGQQTTGKSGSVSRNPNVVCYYCGKKGHWARECRSRISNETTRVDTGPASASAATTTANAPANAPAEGEAAQGNGQRQ